MGLASRLNAQTIKGKKLLEDYLSQIFLFRLFIVVVGNLLENNVICVCGNFAHHPDKITVNSWNEINLR